MNVIYVRFDKSLDYKAVVNSFYIKKFLVSVFGEFPTMVSPTGFTFDRDNLGEFIQNEYNISKPYMCYGIKPFPSTIPYGEKLELIEFETEFLLDDHIVTVNAGDRVLGVFAAEDDFGKIVNALQK